MNKKAKIGLVISLFLVAILALSMIYAPPTPKECNDGLDNDGDGNTDWPADTGCNNKNDNDESDCGDNVCEGGETTGTCPADCPAPTQCNDGLDNDGDGHADYPQDSECSSAADDDESPRDNCADSDGGFNPNTAGTVSGENDNSPFNVSDTCLSSTVLTEYYCGGYFNDYNVLSFNTTCSINATANGCVAGACT